MWSTCSDLMKFANHNWKQNLKFPNPKLYEIRHIVSNFFLELMSFSFWNRLSENNKLVLLCEKGIKKVKESDKNNLNRKRKFHIQKPCPIRWQISKESKELELRKRLSAGSGNAHNSIRVCLSLKLCVKLERRYVGTAASY